MKILITGGAGFIGSNFIHYWLEHHTDDQVINLDVPTYAGNLENLSDIESNHNYTFIKGDICDPEIVSTAMDGVDTVVHFAAETHVDRSISDPTAFVRNQREGHASPLYKKPQNERYSAFTTLVLMKSSGHCWQIGSADKFNEETKYDPCIHLYTQRAKRALIT